MNNAQAVLQFTPPQLTTLAERAMLVNLTVGKYQPYAYDAAASKEIDTLHGTNKAGRFSKRLFAGNMLLKKVSSKFNDVYQYYVLHTVPWMDNGIRMLPSESYFDFTSDMRGLIAKAENSLTELGNAWPQMVQDDMRRLGSLAHAGDYPVSVVDKFYARVQFTPVPDSGDFRVNVSQEDKDALDAAVTNAQNAVSQYLIGEMLVPLQAFVSKMNVPIGQEGAVFRDSLVHNIMGLVYRLPRLNINDDPQITQAIREIEETVGAYAKNPDKLRNSTAAREDARAKLDAVLRDLGIN